MPVQQALARKAKKKKLSPILDQIINGGPSTTLNISRITLTLAEGPAFFETDALNRCIIFKYPNFDVELSGDRSTDYQADDAGQSERRPVETAIYIPNDERFPQEGGYAIYIRQKRSEELLKRHLGVAAEDAPDARAGDIAKLKLIDEIPSLDPFLLKTTFERERIAINPAYLAMEDREENAIKQIIGDRVRPIVSRALGVDNADGGRHARRFIQAIWDPSIPEATLFIEALRIDSSEAGKIFGAWKGVTFYQNQFARSRARIAEILKWFKSPQSVPLDILQFRSFSEQQQMHKTAVQRRMLNILSNINQVFCDLEGCYESFIGNADPVPLRQFLMTSHARYWTLGYCCSALSHCRNIFERSLMASVKGRLTFEQMHEMLTNMESALRSQSDVSAELG